MRFEINRALLAEARNALRQYDGLRWILGGSGSGKTTVCQALAAQYALPVYDMDAYIYGAYHSRFTPDRHPVNSAWAAEPDGFAWLLGMSWNEFDSFHRAAQVEYLDLLCEELRADSADPRLLIDGGVWHPALLAQAVPASQLVCLANPQQTSRQVWEETGGRLEMKSFTDSMTEPERAWRKFLDFDGRITQTLLDESKQQGVRIFSRADTDSVEEFAARVWLALDMI